jgi:HEAT repeat protein
MPDDSGIQYDVFISYAREEQAFAEELRERLHEWDCTTWMDVYNIPAGAYWPDEIDQGLRASRVVVGIVTAATLGSRNVKNEWDWAIVNGKPLILLLLEPCSLPPNYVSINYIDFTGDLEAAFARLQAALASPEAPAPAPADPHRAYLQDLYDRLNTYLAEKIIKTRPDDSHAPEPIPLQSERTSGAVDALFEKRDEIDPLFLIGGIDQKPVLLDGDFRTAFDYFEGRALLLGDPGAGKTITLLYFGRDAVVQRIQDPSKPLPILGIVPTWDARSQPPLAEWLEASYGAPPHVAQVIAEGRALLLLDGLDELGGEREDPETKERYDPRQRFMQVIPSNNEIVVTCRVKDYDEIGEKIALNGAVTLKPLTDDQMRDYLREMPDLWAALDADPALRDVARTPLLLSLFAFAYRGQGTETAKLRDLRHSPGDLRDAIFRQYVQRRYEHEARKLQFRQPPEEMPFTLEEIYEVLGRVAMWNVADFLRTENVLLYRDFVRVLDAERAPAFTEMAVRLHLLSPAGKIRVGLRDSDEENALRFIHLLLRDHVAFGYALPRLRDDDAKVLYGPARALGKLGDMRAVEPLLAALRDDDAIIRGVAALALGELGDARAVEPLLAALSDNDAYFRGSAAFALGKLSDTRAVEPLLAALGDDDAWVRWSAAGALGELGDTRAVEPLLVALHDHDEVVREHAAVALGELGDVRAIGPLVGVLRDQDESVAYGASDGLSRLGGPALEPLLAALRDDDARVRLLAALALNKLGDPRAVEPLIAALDDEDAEVRATATEVLGNFGGSRAVEPLIRRLSDAERPFIPQECIGDYAARSLERIGTPEALAAVEAWRREQGQG